MAMGLRILPRRVCGHAWGGIQFGQFRRTLYYRHCGTTNSGGFFISVLAARLASLKLRLLQPTTMSRFPAAPWVHWEAGFTVPMTLATPTATSPFQCADPGTTPLTLLSGALTGPGGLYKTGGGTLTLSGANNYSGSTVVSNGVLKIIPQLSPTNGSLTLDGSAGSPVLSLVPSSVPQSLTVNGDLTFAAGTPTADFNFSGFTPSTSICSDPGGRSGNVVFTSRRRSQLRARQSLPEPTR